MKRILIVEDDKGISSFVNAELKHEGFATEIAENGRKALECFENNDFDLILLDIMLPELNGIEVLRRIKKNSSVPVIMLTARNETFDKVNGLDSGADDYLTKPFEIEELLARIRTVLRRSSRDSGELKIKDLTLSTNSMTCFLSGEEISLSKIEFLMLKFFMENTGKVLSRDAIIDAVWGKEHFIEENSVDVYVGYLRSKIDKISCTEYLSTVRGAGYIMKDK